MLLRALKLLLIAITVILLMALCAIMLSAATQVPQLAMMAVILVCIAFVMVVAILSTTAAARRRRAAAMLNYLEQAVRHNLPLPRIIRAIGEGETGKSNSRFARDMIAAEQALQEGAPLAVVLSAVPQMPSRVIGLVSAAERVGRLPQVLSRIMEQRRAAIARSMTPGLMPFYRAYPLALALIFVFMTSMLMVFVAPRFETIFKDFKTPLPRVTQLTFEIARGAGPWIAVLLATVILALIIAGISSHWRGGALGLVEGPFGWIANRLPWIGRVRLYRALGDALEFTADAVEAGRPIDVSIAEAAQVGANSRLREIFDRWYEEMIQGRSIADAARVAGMPAQTCSMLATALQTPDLAPVMRFLGRYYSSRFSRAIAFLEASFVPVIALVMGIFVAWLALSVFMPMVRLIDRLGPYPVMIGL